MPPRWSPATTVPSSSGGRPSSAAAPAMSPAASSSRIRLDETPSTSGTGRTSKPSRSQQVEVAAPARAEAEPLPRHHDLRAERPQDEVDELLRALARELGRELDDEHLVGLELLQQLERAARPARAAAPRSRARGAGAGANVTTHERRPVARAASTTARWPRCTPSNVPIATARAAGSASAGERSTVTRSPSRAGRHRPPRTPRPGACRRRRARPARLPPPEPAVRTRRPARPPRPGRCAAGGRRRRAAAGSSPSSASSTRNGPTAVRRSATQCPPSASAIDRM